MYISINIYVVNDNKSIAVHFANCISRYLESPVTVTLSQSHCFSFRPGEVLHCHRNCPTNGEIELVGFFGSVPVYLPLIHLLPSPRHFPHSVSFSPSTPTSFNQSLRNSSFSVSLVLFEAFPRAAY